MVASSPKVIDSFAELGIFQACSGRFFKNVVTLTMTSVKIVYVNFVMNFIELVKYTPP